MYLSLRKISLFILVLLIFSPRTTSSYQFHTTPDRWKEPRIFYGKFDKDLQGRIKISHIKPDINTDHKNRRYSPNNAYWFVVDDVDTTKPSPWTTQVRIFNERDYIISIVIKDYSAQYDMNAHWINDKLIYLQFWWGRVVGSYLIFDVEKEEVVIKEMFYEGGQVFQQWQKKKDE
ncbi:MAG: hypothetical protein SNJ53_06100 [Thermodesulfovibrionales bacterium]